MNRNRALAATMPTTEEGVAAACLAALGLVFILFVALLPRIGDHMPVAPWSPMGEARQVEKDKKDFAPVAPAPNTDPVVVV